MEIHLYKHKLFGGDDEGRHPRGRPDKHLLQAMQEIDKKAPGPGFALLS
jgi:hypothetical protein